MKKIFDNLSIYYKTNKMNQKFYPAFSVENGCEIFESKLVLKNVTLKIDLDKSIELYGCEHMFSNIFLVLIENSLDEFKSKNSNIISIKLAKQGSYLQIKYKDNAGGIKIKPIESVFDYFVSSKSNDDIQGVGLAIVKYIVTEKFLGTISVCNVDDGVEFTIVIPLK